MTHQTHSPKSDGAERPGALEKVPYPEYQPRSYRELRIVLGESDSGMEWMEVGVRHLKAEHATGGKARMDELAEFYGVKVNAFDWNRVARQWAHLQIISVCQYLEWFLDEFRRELNRPFRQRRSKEDLLHYTLDVLKLSSSSVGVLEVAILDYYRIVRNHFLHDPDAEEPKRLLARRASIRDAIPGSLYMNLEAPNDTEGTQFDDFVIFSRAVKNFSKRLCAQAPPTIQELKEYIKNDRKFVQKLRERQQSSRLAVILAGYIRQRFGFPSRVAEVSAILLKDGLLAQPVEFPLQEPIESRSVAEGGGRGSSPRRATKKTKDRREQ